MADDSTEVPTRFRQRLLCYGPMLAMAVSLLPLMLQRRRLATASAPTPPVLQPMRYLA
jgi:hypothetical protein